MRVSHLQDGDGLVEVVVLHGGRRVYRRQGGGALHHEGVRLAAVVEVVAQTRHEQGNRLQ